ncbi:MAG: di-heme-cytochrome C peroxidase [Pseudomonadota bacterium]|nr:di-heme-cytochrome C peroxidase [Pseudomonadota bacterium]
MKTHFSFSAALSGAVLYAATIASSIPAGAADSNPVLVDQGPNWTPATRAEFYIQDQGSRIMPLSWFEALKQSGGSPFLADSLGRYGYLPNPANSNGLPVGFTASGPQGSRFAGMTCAACHTRQISADGKEYRIDGGPAIVDFQSFLVDLDAAVGRVLGDDATFQTFASVVLGPAAPQPDDAAALHDSVKAWYLRYHTLITRALPTTPWGPSRLDAVGMIFNRLTGLDLGPPPSYLIPDNIKHADAPARYPFLWNAPKQDKTQWPGFANNGNDILALGRNLGQVYGVFGVFAPKKNPWNLLGVNYLNNNSANFDGLDKLEGLVKQIGPPKWPWLPVDAALAERGKAIYNRPTKQGGCGDCHAIREGEVRFFNVHTWGTTPLQDVGTDTKEWDILKWQAQTGVLKNAPIPLSLPLRRFGETDTAFGLLSASVIGSIVQNSLTLAATALDRDIQAQETQARELAQETQAATAQAKQVNLPPALQDLKGAFHLPDVQSPSGKLTAQTPEPVFEARVMEGIWAAAPYLHNGSVPTLYDLLLPVDQRPKSFKIGPAYDKTKVGLAIEQTKFDYTLNTTDCSDRNSGNSRCGHEFGTQLPPEEKKALLEYLKTL